MPQTTTLLDQLRHCANSEKLQSFWTRQLRIMYLCKGAFTLFSVLLGMDFICSVSQLQFEDKFDDATKQSVCVFLYIGYLLLCIGVLGIWTERKWLVFSYVLMWNLWNGCLLVAATSGHSKPMKQQQLPSDTSDMNHWIIFIAYQVWDVFSALHVYYIIRMQKLLSEYMRAPDYLVRDGQLVHNDRLVQLENSVWFQ